MLLLNILLFLPYLFWRSQWWKRCYNRSTIPQGSILGPLIFISFVYNNSKCLMHSNFNIHAYDTSQNVSDECFDDLFLWGLSSHSRIFQSYGDVTRIGEGLQILTFEDPWHSHQLPSVLQRSCHYLFLRLRSVAAGIRTPNFPHASRTL